MALLIRESVIELKKHITFIQPDEGLLQNNQAMSISQRLLAGYLQQVNDKLQSILENNSDEALRSALIAFLNDQWKMIQGSTLCYTSPNNLHAQLFFKLTNDLCTELQSPLELMMPGVHLESLSNDFFDWKPLLAPKKLTKNEQQDHARLTRLKNAGQLDDACCLSTEDSVQLDVLSRKKELSTDEINVFTKLHEKEKATNERHQYEALQNAYTNRAFTDDALRLGRLTEKDDFLIPMLPENGAHFFSQHLLDDEKTSIIPIALLLNEDDSKNPYSGKPLTENERYRLYQHSEITKALDEGRKNRDHLMNDG